MVTEFDRLFFRENVKPNPPATAAELQSLHDAYPMDLSAAAFSLWNAANGIALESIDAHVPSISEISALVTEDVWDFGLADRGYLPILDDHQSNYLMLVVQPPLAHRVVHFPHDDAPRLIYRDTTSFVDALIECLNEGETADLYFYEEEGDYPADAPRSQRDQAAARDLLQTENNNDEWLFALQLLDASNLNEFSLLLETDHFVRRDVVARMRKMNDERIRKLLKKDQASFDAFAEAAVDAARKAGFNVGKRKGDVLQVDRKWMNLEAFFHLRNQDGAMQRMLARFGELTKNKER